MIENLDELLIIRKEFTNTTQMFYLMTGKREIMDDMAALFLSDDISSAQRSVCCAILKGIYQDFIHFLCDRLSKQHETKPLLDVSVDDMTPEDRQNSDTLLVGLSDGVSKMGGDTSEVT